MTCMEVGGGLCRERGNGYVDDGVGRGPSSNVAEDTTKLLLCIIRSIRNTIPHENYTRKRCGHSEKELRGCIVIRCWIEVAWTKGVAFMMMGELECLKKY